MLPLMGWMGKPMRRVVVAGCLGGVVASVGGVECARGEVLTEVERQQADRIESLSIPSAGEFFAAMAKVDRPNWGVVGRVAVPMGSSDRGQIALCLGVLIADGYLAVENQNSQEMKNIVRDLIEMAKKLNVGSNVAGRGPSLTDFAENNEWNSLQEELEATRNELKISLVGQKDEGLVFLVSTGVWLRAVQAAAIQVESNYNPAVSSLLAQGWVAERFLQRIDSLSEKMKGAEMIVRVRGAIEQMREEMVAGEGGVLSYGQIEKICKVATEAVDRIVGVKVVEAVVLPVLPVLPAEETPIEKAE